MIENIRIIFALDSWSLTLIFVLMFLVTLVFRAMTEARALTIVLIPLLNVGGVVGVWAYREYGLSFIPNRDSEIIFASLLGMIVVMLAMLAFVRLYFSVTSNVSQRAVGKLTATK